MKRNIFFGIFLAFLFTAGAVTATHIYPWLYELPVVTITSGICAPFSNTCIDTDGPDIFHQGFLTVASNLGSGPFCVGNFPEYSAGNDVIEFHCGNGVVGQTGTLYAARIPCPTGYTSYQGRCVGGPLLVNHLCGDGVCQNVGVSLLVRDNYLLVNDNGINYLVRIIGTSDPITVVIEVDGIAQAFQTGQATTFNGLPFQVVSVIHFANNQQNSGANLRFGENPISCPVDCGGGNQTNQTNYTACVGNTCVMVPGSGINQCSPVGAFCNQTNQTNQSITCFSNANCPPQTTYYCSGSSACSSTTNFNCVNPGTPQSSCAPFSGGGGCGLCTFGCTNGACNQNQTNHTACIGNTCTLFSGSGINQCSPVGAFCNITGGNQTNQTNTTLPDLTIFSFSVTTIVYNNQTNQTNQTNATTAQVTLSAVVRNIGNAVAGTSTTRISVAGVGAFNLLTPSLNPGAQTTVSATFTVAAPATYSATATADVSNVVAESNENNNAATISFTV